MTKTPGRGSSDLGGGGLGESFVRFKDANKKNFQNATVVWTYDLHCPGVVTHSLSK